MNSKNNHSFSTKNHTSIKQRIWKRVAIALLLSGGIIFSQKMGWLDHFTNQIMKQKINWSNNQEVIQYLKQLTADRHLTDIPANCLIPVINNDDGGSILPVEFHEKHNTECQNTRPDFPVVFTFHVNRLNGNIQIDKGSPNHFYPIP